MTYAKCSKADIVGETSQLLQYISPQFLLKSQVKAQDGKSLIMSVILIGIDFSSRWELFISRGNTYFHRSRNDINPREQMKLKLGIFLSLFLKNPIIDRSITHCSIWGESLLRAILFFCSVSKMHICFLSFFPVGIRHQKGIELLRHVHSLSALYAWI